MKTKCWKVRDKALLLLAVMEELAGDAHVSFEGDLRGLTLATYPGASLQPTAVLKRNTIWPNQDFVVVPLEPTASKKIIAALGGTVPGTVLHVQIEKRGVLEFGAYDNFHPKCIFFGSAVAPAIVESLVSDGVMRPEESAPNSR
jgi:hypothetical protein